MSTWVQQPDAEGLRAMHQFFCLSRSFSGLLATREIQVCSKLKRATSGFPMALLHVLKGYDSVILYSDICFFSFFSARTDLYKTSF